MKTYEIVPLSNSLMGDGQANKTCGNPVCPNETCPSINIVCGSDIFCDVDGLCSCPPPEDIYCGAIWHGCATGMR